MRILPHIWPKVGPPRIAPRTLNSSQRAIAEKHLLSIPSNEWIQVAAVADVRKRQRQRTNGPGKPLEPALQTRPRATGRRPDLITQPATAQPRNNPDNTDKRGQTNSPARTGKIPDQRQKPSPPKVDRRIRAYEQDRPTRTSDGKNRIPPMHSLGRATTLDATTEECESLRAADCSQSVASGPGSASMS